MNCQVGCLGRVSSVVLSASLEPVKTLANFVDELGPAFTSALVVPTTAASVLLAVVATLLASLRVMHKKLFVGGPVKVGQ